MKMFLAVVAAAIVIGGFVGAELMDSSFSITGAVVGGVGTAAGLLGLGAFFEAQDRRRKDKALTPEVREAFDRMFSGQRLMREHSKLKTKNQENRAKNPPSDFGLDREQKYIMIVEGLISAQLASGFSTPRESFGTLMTNKAALGYVFGFHDALLQHTGLYDSIDSDKSKKLIEKSYKNIFGEQSGYTLFSSSLNNQENTDFSDGRLVGGNDLFEFTKDKVPPVGLLRILFLPKPTT